MAEQSGSSVSLPLPPPLLLLAKCLFVKCPTRPLIRRDNSTRTFSMYIFDIYSARMQQTALRMKP
jgi:hypothetical protein